MINNAEEKVCLENIFTVWSTLGCLNDGLNLPNDVKKAIFNVFEVCEPYIENGFTYTIQDED